MTKVKSYVKEVLARITGDEKAVIAEKNYRKASAAAKGQIASLEAKLVGAEDQLDNANEALVVAKYPTTSIGEGKNYIQGIIDAQASVDNAQKNVDDIKASIKFNQGLLAEFDAEVEA